jgi:hypothetical protein
MTVQAPPESASPAPASEARRAQKTVTRQRERLFYSGMAIAILIVVVAGFAPTYFLRPLFTTAPLPRVLHVHGVVFTAWLVLYVAQSLLVAANRTRVHRRLGMAGAWLAGVMVVVGTYTALVRAKAGAAPPGVDPLAFLAVPLFDMLVFSTLVATGISLRRRPDVHKRLMLMAMVSILSAAFARLPGVGALGPPGFFGLTDSFVALCVVYDLAALGRVHRATWSSGLFVVISQPLRLMLSATPAWLAFAKWATGLVG